MLCLNLRNLKIISEKMKTYFMRHHLVRHIVWLLAIVLLASCVTTEEDEDRDRTQSPQDERVSTDEYDVTFLVILPYSIGEFYDLHITYTDSIGAEQTQTVTKTTTSETMSDREQAQWKSVTRQLQSQLDSEGSKVNTLFFSNNVVKHITLTVKKGTRIAYSSKLTRRSKYTTPTTSTVDLLFPVILVGYSPVYSSKVDYLPIGSVTMVAGLSVRNLDAYLAANVSTVPAQGEVNL